MDERAVLAGLPHCVLTLDTRGTITYANPAALRLTGERELVGRPALELVAPAQRDRGQRLLSRCATEAAGPVRLRLAGSTLRWAAVDGAPLPGGCAVLSLTDVTEQVRRRLRRSEHPFRAAFEAAAQGSALVGEHGHLLIVNRALAELLGRSQPELVGVHVATLLDAEAVGAEGAQHAAEWTQHAADATQHAAVPRRLRHADGGLVHTLVTTTRVTGDAGERFSLIQVQDVTERRRSEQRLRHLALHDQLTELPSRNLLLERLHTALELRTEAAPLVAALFVDVDEFKLINDALGHAVGDLVLREVALRLRHGTRPQDTVARMSGDEFVVVCPALAAPDEAVAIAERLSEALRLPVLTAADEVLVSASIGVAFAGPGDDSAEQLLHDADAAMYRAKQLGRRRYEVFDSALRELAVQRKRIRELLSRAIAQDRVTVHYQPVVDVVNRKVVALEALLRVRDDDGSLLLPEAFLEIAAESGVLPKLDDVVLRQASAAVARWSKTVGCELGLAVNLCSAQVDERLAGAVLGVLAESGLSPAQLLVEVTERTLAGAGKDAERWLAELQAQGVAVALDDFGTGWGSLTYLRRLPVSMLKVDRSFVALLPEDRDGLVRAVVGLAAQLGLDATAEGVETEEQYAAVRAVAAPYAQGWLFGGPVPEEEVLGLLDQLGVQEGGSWPPAGGAARRQEPSTDS